MKYCSNCGIEVEKMQYCPSCGANLNLQAKYSHSYQSQPKSQVIAFILCFFGGLLGFHRFYIGKIGTGILMLFMGPFFIFGMTAMEKAEISGRGLSESGNTIVMISAILGVILVILILIDLIRILTGNFTDSNSNEGASHSNYGYKNNNLAVKNDNFMDDFLR